MFSFVYKTPFLIHEKFQTNTRYPLLFLKFLKKKIRLLFPGWNFLVSGFLILAKIEKSRNSGEWDLDFKIPKKSPVENLEIPGINFGKFEIFSKKSV